MIVVYGLGNCDTCRKARAWLDTQGIAHSFVDVRKQNVDAATVAGWAAKVGWQSLINRRGTTWRGLPEAEKQDLDEPRAIALAARHPALIRRPVWEADGEVMVGFDAEIRQRLVAG